MDYFVRAKFYIQRSMIYYQLASYLMIAIMFLRPFDLNIWLQGTIIIVVAISAIFVGRMDRKLKILEKEIGISNAENIKVIEIQDSLQRIEEKLITLYFTKKGGSE